MCSRISESSGLWHTPFRRCGCCKGTEEWNQTDLRLTPDFAIYWFCGLGEGTEPLSASVFSSRKWGSPCCPGSWEDYTRQGTESPDAEPGMQFYGLATPTLAVSSCGRSPTKVLISGLYCVQTCVGFHSLFKGSTGLNSRRRLQSRWEGKISA